VGHSGEDHKVELTSFDKPPKNNKERLKVVKVTKTFCENIFR
jgi:hypothetical protein